MDEHDLVRIFKALADKTRQDILELISREEMNVTDICSEFHVSQPTVSHHLHILKDCGLIDYRKEGKKIYYCVKREVMDDAFGRVVKKMRVRIVRKSEDV